MEEEALSAAGGSAFIGGSPAVPHANAPLSPAADDCLAVQAVEVQARMGGAVILARFTFFLERVVEGAYKDCWLIHECRPGDLTGLFN